MRLAWVVPALALAAACTPIAANLAAVPDTGVPPYSREEFGDGWASIGGGCDVRDVVLARDLNPDQRDGCDVTGGTLFDPYTGAVLVGPSRALDVDHRVPLSYAWDRGAWRWTQDRREAFANDPAGLVATAARVNREKGDDGPGEWLPPRDPCGYAREFDVIADRWALDDDRRDAEVATACR